MTINKGDVVTVVKGKAAGASGPVFWVGTTKFGKERVGVKTAAGDVWAGLDQVAPQAPEQAVAVGPVVAGSFKTVSVPVVPVADAGLAARVQALEAQVQTLQLALSALAGLVNTRLSAPVAEQAEGDAEEAA